MTVVDKTDANGDVHIGVTVGGVFVAVASVPAARVAQLVQRGENIAAVAKAKVKSDGA